MKNYIGDELPQNDDGIGERNVVGYVDFSDDKILTVSNNLNDMRK